MARLILLSEFRRSLDQLGLDPHWYFPDAYWHDRQARFTIASGYPASCAMHQDRFDTHISKDAVNLRVTIRRWIEQNLSGDVILEQRNMDHRWEWNPNRIDKIRHGYMIFHFETDADMMHFRLRFSEYVDDIRPTHPKLAK